MKYLHKRTYKLWLTLSLALALTVLPSLVAPLLSSEVADLLPNVDVILADEPEGGTAG